MTTPPFEPPAGGEPEGHHQGPARWDEAGYQPACPNCGAAHDPLQEYCLECGQRLVPLPFTTTTREVWTRESPIWLWLALGALLLVALAAGAIVALAATDDETGAGASVASSTAPPIETLTSPTTVLPPPTIETVTTPTVTISTGTTTAPTTTTTPMTTTFPTTTTTGGSSGIIDWPANKDGFTIVLKSTPTSQGRGPAEAAAQQARSAGLPQVGILESSDYSSLNPGYYVTFTGIYDTKAQAESALPNARSKGFPTAYVREVSD